ncbi:NAD(P)-binding domain [Plasmopara halstedii]|uniref:NAD(P)-binding domain n=1 Tax=Plasmopara halstedii TaxID=4781 RepID=A0A0P1APT6_PLAHL|nr:NAD(P)-binding domain [Plasmopara halstedii]CEG42799.1 NAD(P)-binding domain [Plasmopara halstedii]|eukprot:XP_024579168.1 NAD(P)-binding domain [Plasmopara halstedii]
MNLPSNSMDEWLCCEQNIASLGLNNHRVIKLSWTEGFVTEHSASTIGRQNWRLEKELKRSFQDRPENLTIVRASTGMDAFLRGRLYDLICGRTLSMSVKTGRIAFIHPLDVAESLSALLIKDAPEELYKLTGPEALSFKEVADIFSLEIQDKVTYSYFPLWAVQPARWVRGVPGDAIEEELGIARALESGAQQEVEYGTLEKLLGHKPRTLREFIAEHADAWPRTDPN